MHAFLKCTLNLQYFEKKDQSHSSEHDNMQAPNTAQISKEQLLYYYSTNLGKNE